MSLQNLSDRQLQQLRHLKTLPAHPLAVDSARLSRGVKAIDIGCGALRETSYLIQQGFEVWAIDKSDHINSAEFAPQTDRFHPVTLHYEDYKFPENFFDVVLMINGASFIHPKQFDQLWRSIRDAGVRDSIYGVTFFGPGHAWANTHAHFSFFTKSSALECFRDFDIIRFTEYNGVRSTYSGERVAWHSFDVLARKR